jgi:glycosyltransferase involved in cell wall biosynthesis
MTDPNCSRELSQSVAVILPCYRETSHILSVIKKIGSEVLTIYVVDDACPDLTGAFVQDNCTDKRVRVITQDVNSGVGGAMVTGYQQALKDGHDILVKIDGDGQMNPNLVPKLITPILEKKADYAKGNRFHKIDSVMAMPKSRIFGNVCLSFLSKISSGYWSVFDPTNGFTALHRTAAERLPFESIAKGYFFESDILFRLGMIRAVVEDVPMDAVYGSEVSGMSILKIIPEFIAKHFLNTCKRIYFNYFLRDFGLTSFQFLFGNILLWFGVIFGTTQWYESELSGIPATAGTVVLAALPIILGSQFMISFFNSDIKNVPTISLQLNEDVTD